MKTHSIISSLVLTIVLTSCVQSQPKDPIVSSDYAHHFLATAINLNPDSTIVLLEDYFEDPAKIDSVIPPKGLDFKYIDGAKKLLLLAQITLEPLSVLEFHYDNENIFIPIKKSSKKNVVFTFDPQGKTYESVNIVGDINAWNAANTPLHFNGHDWETNLTLLPGIYQYQMVVDGEWMLDPNQPEKLDNGIGGWNSKLTVEGEDQSLKPIIYSQSFTANEIVIGHQKEVQQLIALWHNQLLEVERKDNRFTFLIPDKAKGLKRSFVRVMAYNASGLSNELLIPVESGFPVKETKQLTREDKATNITYFLLVDRFNNGEKSNDAPLHDPEVDPRADYYGGDIEGILQKLEAGYFEKLGINTIWLSPIVQNPQGAYGLFDKEGVKSKFSAYHGYWPISFTQIDPRFGSEAAFKKLVQRAHEKGMNVFVDFVANHVHEQHPIYQLHKDEGWTTNLHLPDGSLNTERWDDHRLTTWFDVFLPTLNLEKAEVAEMLSDSALYWVKHYDIDGFRHDAAKHIPNNFWRTLTKKIKNYSVENNKQITQIGETYGTPELINSYLNTGMLDGQFDFNVFDALLQTICKEDNGFEILEEKMIQSFDYYGVNNLMGYISGNQDRARFMALATGDVRFDEDSKLAGWKRKITTKTKKGFDQLGIMNTILLTIPGIPVIFYGDEIGLTGGNDPDCRRMMKFDSLNDYEHHLMMNTAKVAHLRRNNMAFLYGDFTFLKAKDDVLVYSRKYFDQIGIVFINNSDEETEVSVPIPAQYDIEKPRAVFSGEFTVNDGVLTVKLPAYSTQILTE